jgi:hypothetical protein
MIANFENLAKVAKSIVLHPAVSLCLTSVRMVRRMH